MNQQNDPVHHPSHYTQGKVECIEAIESALGSQGFIAFLRGQVIKYNWRLTHKSAPLQDAQKAKWYSDLLVVKMKAVVDESEASRILGTGTGRTSSNTWNTSNTPKADPYESITKGNSPWPIPALNLGRAKTDENKGTSNDKEYVHEAAIGSSWDKPDHICCGIPAGSACKYPYCKCTPRGSEYDSSQS